MAKLFKVTVDGVTYVGDLSPVADEPLDDIWTIDGKRCPPLVIEAIKGHWPSELWTDAARISYCESGWNRQSHNTNGEDSRGIFQINVGRGAHPHLATEDLWDAGINAYYAYRIYRDAGGWRPWYNCANKLGLL